MDTAALENMGFGAGAVDATPPQLWPCVMQPVRLLCAVQTQWRVGPAGHRLGLDYGVLPATFRLLQVPRADWQEMFRDLQVLEQAALEELAK